MCWAKHMPNITYTCHIYLLTDATQAWSDAMSATLDEGIRLPSVTVTQCDWIHLSVVAITCITSKL